MLYFFLLIPHQNRKKLEKAHISYIKVKLNELVGKYENKIKQGGFKFLDDMLDELKEQFDQAFITSSEKWELSIANINRLKTKMMEIIGSDLNIQRMKDEINNDLDKIFNSQQTSSKKDTTMIEVTNQFTKKLQFN
jgi:hypothetical protein